MNVKKEIVFVAALAVGMAVTGVAADPWALGVNPYDFVVYDPKMPLKYEECKPTEFGDRYNCHFQVIYDANRKTYFAFWTQATKEADKDMHIAFSKSTDLKAGWTQPIVLGGSERRSDPRPTACWQQPMLSAKGRLYCLWNQQLGTNRCHYGIMRGRYSDDAGEHWSPAEDAAAWPTNVLRRWNMPADTPPHWCIWQRPLRFGPGGSFFVGVTHGSCRVGFLNYTNIDENPEIADIGFRFFHATSDTYLKGPKGGSCCEEASIVKLPDGRLFALLRSRMGHPLWTQSRDGGCTWQAPRPLEKPNGEKFLHCCSPCPMYDWKGCEAGSGTYFALIHNTYDFKKKNQPRGPLYLIAGTFDPTGEQPVRFSEPKPFAPRQNGNAFYASYTVDENGVGILWFCDMKRWLLGRKIGSEWFSTSPSGEALRFARVFGDGMVLQREKPVPVWGFAEQGTKVTVSFAGQSVPATADVRGRWQVRLAPMAASFEGRTLSVSAQSDGQTSKESNGQVVLSDVRVGEVWILAGQSNMQYGLGGVDGWADARARSAKGELSALRFFRPDQESRSPTPLADLKAGAWHATTDTEAFGRLSAAGFHFAEALLPALKVPVGLVNVPRGGTQMFQWVDEATFASDERFAACLKAKGKKKAPCEDWNGKVAPLAGLAVRGVVWYQGESDSWNPYPSSNFAPMLEKMIACWRKAWGNPDLPFVVAQLPSMDARFWARTREAQDAVARKLKGVSLANLIDTGWCHDVHPHDKQWVGPRLANVALKTVYGRTDVAVAPRLKDVSFAAGRATVAFDAPVTAKEPYRRGFELKAGGAWRPAASASVRADGTVEVVAADAAVRPEGVRYLYEGWAKPDVWLFGADGTPAFAFTTVPADLDQALAASPATLFLAGDSTLDEHGGDESKYASWGSSLRSCLKPGARIVNYAKSGRSTKSFRDEGWWDRILSEVRPGDFVLIQFGHNDQKLDKPKVAVPQAQFKTNLWQMVREVRARHATPFFATPIVRLTYADGHLVDRANLDAWAQRMREVAYEANVRLIDMRKLTQGAAEAAGEREALTWNAPGDRTHPAKKGARLYGELFLKDVTSRKLELAHLFERTE